MSVLRIKNSQGQWVPILAIKGDQGNGIVSVTKTGTVGLVDTYTITYTDGSTSTFDVTNGATPVIDATLTKEGEAADAKAVGDTIKQIDDAMSILVKKKRVEPTIPSDPVQCVDFSVGTVGHSEGDGYYLKNAKILLPWLGAYYPNPTGIDLQFVQFVAYNDNGEKIKIYRSGVEWDGTITATSKNDYFVLENRRTLIAYHSDGSKSWTWTFDDDVSDLGKGSSSSYIEYYQDENQSVGFTFGASENYVEYNASLIPSIEYTDDYNSNMVAAIQDDIASDYTDEVPIENSDNFVKSGGVISYLLKETYNLIDPSWFDWTDEATASNIGLKPDIYVPVVSGRILLSNVSKVRYTFYDAGRESISTQGTLPQYAASTVPNAALYM